MWKLLSMTIYTVGYTCVLKAKNHLRITAGIHSYSLLNHLELVCGLGFIDQRAGLSWSWLYWSRQLILDISFDAIFGFISSWNESQYPSNRQVQWL